MHGGDSRGRRGWSSRVTHTTIYTPGVGLLVARFRVVVLGDWGWVGVSVRSIDDLGLHGGGGAIYAL